MNHFSRRKFLQFTAAAGASFYLGVPPLKGFAAAREREDSPMSRHSGSFASTDFNGDDVRRPHKLLWDVEGYIRSKGGRPTTFRPANVVVVGGGMAGLLSAYFLKDQKPILLEQAEKFGGNSQGESIPGANYSIGAAYVTVLEAGSDIEKFFAELGLNRLYRHEPEADARVIFNGIKDLWQGETDPAALASAEKISAELERVYENAYPEIPWSKGDPLSFDQLKALDSQTAIQWLRRVDPKLHPHVEEFFQLYGWSSFGASLDELSAAQFLNFVSSETQGVLAFPGGNSAITSALHAHLRRALPPGSLASNSIVLEVKETSAGVEVLYEDTEGTLRLIHARTVVFAAPKYVAKALIKDISPGQAEAWKSMHYRAYVVANVLLRQKISAEAFDLFYLKGKVPEAPSFGRRPARPFTDLVYADWANGDKSPRSVLTLYKPFPYEGARNTLMDTVSHNRIVKEVETEARLTLQQLGVPEGSIEGIRLTRWGHSVPVAAPGLIASGMMEKIGASHGRIHFANQDNYMNPAFETAFAAAQRASATARLSVR